MSILITKHMSLFEKHPAWRVLLEVKHWQKFLYWGLTLLHLQTPNYQSQILRNGEIVRAVLGLGSMHASRVKSQTLGNTDLDSLEPQMFKVFTTFFPQNLESGVKRAWNFA
jgi:hypothetical protein